MTLPEGWWGPESWGAAAHAVLDQVPVPAGAQCALCRRAIEDGEYGFTGHFVQVEASPGEDPEVVAATLAGIGLAQRMTVHRECLHLHDRKPEVDIDRDVALAFWVHGN